MSDTDGPYADLPETELRAVISELGIDGHAEMSREDLERELVEYTAMRMREDASGRHEDRLNRPPPVPPEDWPEHT